jgi:putative redox protein
MSDETLRRVDVERVGLGRYRAVNARGATLLFGSGEDDDFSAVELFLAALGGCGAAYVDYIVSKRAEPETFAVTVTGDKIRDDAGGNRLINLAVTFRVGFPDGEGGDQARAVLPRAVAQSHDRLCTVSRTVQAGTPVENRVADAP